VGLDIWGWIAVGALVAGLVAPYAPGRGGVLTAALRADGERTEREGCDGAAADQRASR
jgi:hypothetical protein